MRTTLLFLASSAALCMSLVAPSNAHALGKPRPQETHLMGVLGDSIPSGTFADTSAGRVTFPLYHSITTLPQELFQYLLQLPVSGFRWEAPLLIRNKLTYSWASGQLMNSHFTRLREMIETHSQDKESLSVYNAAIPGKRSDNLPRQTRRFLETVNKNKYLSVPYVTIMIGANDVCTQAGNVTSNEAFTAHLRETFALLAEQASKNNGQPIRVLLPGMPNIPLLGQKHIRESRTISGLKCKTVRDRIFRFCPRLTKWNSAEEFETLKNIVLEKNRILENIAQEVSAQYPGIEARYSNRFFEYDIQPDVLAMDCFHPNSKGHQTLSNLLWEDQAWF